MSRNKIFLIALSVVMIITAVPSFALASELFAADNAVAEHSSEVVPESLSLTAQEYECELHPNADFRYIDSGNGYHSVVCLYPNCWYYTIEEGLSHSFEAINSNCTNGTICIYCDSIGAEDFHYINGYRSIDDSYHGYACGRSGCYYENQGVLPQSECDFSVGPWEHYYSSTSPEYGYSTEVVDGVRRHTRTEKCLYCDHYDREFNYLCSNPFNTFCDGECYNVSVNSVSTDVIVE